MENPVCLCCGLELTEDVDNNRFWCTYCEKGYDYSETDYRENIILGYN